MPEVYNLIQSKKVGTCFSLFCPYLPVPGKPASLTFWNVTYISLDVHWEQPLHPNGRIVNYELSYLELNSIGKYFFDIVFLDLMNVFLKHFLFACYVLFLFSPVNNEIRVLRIDLMYDR